MAAPAFGLGATNPFFEEGWVMISALFKRMKSTV